MTITLPVRENLELRTLTPLDAQTLFDVTKKNDAHLREWLPWLDDDKTALDTENYIKESNERLSKDEGVDLSIWYEEELVEGIGVFPLDLTHRKTSLAYWLAEEFQGKGIMSDSLNIAIEYLFTEKKLNRIEVCCATENTKSSALPKKLGFTFEGIAREAECLYGRFVDMEVYSLLAKEWRGQNLNTN